MTVSNTTKLAIVIIFGLLAATTLIYTAQQPRQSVNDDGVTPDQNSFNRADLMFMNMMIIHHDQAIRMAELAPNRTENEDVLELAANISEAQRRENGLMAEWLRSQGYQRPTRGHRMAGMASEAEIQRLEQSTGEVFNELFAELMIEHHEGGIEMAQAEVRNGASEKVVFLAEDMVSVQQKEVNTMQSWLTDWRRST